MAARRLLIVMLILLGLSTLAAALLPPRSLRDTTSTEATTTQPTQTQAAPAGPSCDALMAKLSVGGTTVPVLAGATKATKQCPPIEIRVGVQLDLKVKSPKATELEFPHFGLVGIAAPNLPAHFNVLLDEEGSFGIVYATNHKVAARIEVLPAGTSEQGKTKGKREKEKAAKPEAPEGSDQR